MSKATPLSIRVPEELSERLDALAKATDRSKSFLAVINTVDQDYGHQGKNIFPAFAPPSSQVFNLLGWAYLSLRGRCGKMSL